MAAAAKAVEEKTAIAVGSAAKEGTWVPEEKKVKTSAFDSERLAVSDRADHRRDRG